MIRKFEEKDIKAIMSLWLNTNKEAHNFIPEKYWEEHFENVQNMLPQSNLYVYERENELLGFCGLVENYIAGIFVHKAYQCQGIGKALLNFIKQEKEYLTLKVYEKNKRAFSFYLKEGFILVAEEVDLSTNEKEFLMEWKKFNQI